MSDKAVSNDPLMLKHCLDSYKIQELLWNQKNVFIFRRWWNIYPKNEYDRLVFRYKTYLYQKKLSEQQIKIAFLSSYKSIILIFPLGQISFSSSYKTMILIFSLMRIAFFQVIKILLYFSV